MSSSEFSNKNPIVPSEDIDSEAKGEGTVTESNQIESNPSSAQHGNDVNEQTEAQTEEPIEGNLKKSKFSSMMDLFRRKPRSSSSGSLPEVPTETSPQEPVHKSREKSLESLTKRLQCFTLDLGKLRRRHRSDTSTCQVTTPVVASEALGDVKPQPRPRITSCPSLPASNKHSKEKTTALEGPNDLSSNSQSPTKQQSQIHECSSNKESVFKRLRLTKSITIPTFENKDSMHLQKSLIDELSFALHAEAEEIFFPAKCLKRRRSFPSGQNIGDLSETVYILQKQCKHFICVLRRLFELSKKLFRSHKNKTLVSRLNYHVYQMISQEEKVLRLLKEEDFSPISFSSEASSCNLLSYEFLHVEFSNILSLRDGLGILKDSWEIFCKYLIIALDAQKNLILMLSCLLPHCENDEVIRGALSTLTDTQKQWDTEMVINSLIDCPIRKNKISTLEYFSDVESSQLSNDLLHMVRFENFLMFCKPSFAHLHYKSHYRIDQINKFVKNGHKVVIYGQNGNSKYEPLELTPACSNHGNFESYFKDIVNFCSVASFDMLQTVRPSDFKIPPSLNFAGSIPFSVTNIFDDLASACNVSDRSVLEPPLVSLELLRRQFFTQEKKYLATLEATQNEDVPPPFHQTIKEKIAEIYEYHSKVFYPWVEEASHDTILKAIQGLCLHLQLYEEFIQIRSYCVVIFDEDSDKLFYVSPIRRLTEYLNYLNDMAQYTIFEKLTKPSVNAINRCITTARVFMHTGLLKNCTIDFFRLGDFMAECPVFTRDKTAESHSYILVLFTKGVLIVSRSEPLYILDTLLWLEQMHDLNIKTEKRTMFFRYHQGSRIITYRIYGYSSYQQLFEQVMHLIESLYNNDRVKNSWNKYAPRITAV